MIALLFVVFSGCRAVYLADGNLPGQPDLPDQACMRTQAAALIYNFTVHRTVATMENPPPVLSKAVATVSLVLWVSVVFGGIFTGFLV